MEDAPARSVLLSSRRGFFLPLPFDIYFLLATSDREKETADRGWKHDDVYSGTH